MCFAALASNSHPSLRHLLGGPERGRVVQLALDRMTAPLLASAVSTLVSPLVLPLEKRVKGPVDLFSPASIYDTIRDTIHHGLEHMLQKKEIMDKLSIYIPSRRCLRSL